MGAQLQDLVDEVIGAAEEAGPEHAEGILVDAADQFREAARQRENQNIAAVLAARANEFEARAQAYRAFTTEPVPVQPRATVDDFHELERDQAVAHAQVGRLDDLEIKAARNAIRKMRHGRLRVSIAPESITEDTWRLGNQVNVKFAPTQADMINQIKVSDTVVLWQGTKVEAQSFTIDVGVTGVPALNSGVSCRPFGIVTYGSDGYQMSFTFDVNLGVRLTGVGNYCSVLVGMGAPRAGVPSGVMSIGASLGFFAATSQAPVTFTNYVDGLVAAGASTPIARPSRGSFILSPQSSDVNGQMQLDFIDYAGSIRTSLFFASGTVVSPIPVAPEIAGVVLNNKGANTANFTIPWQLST